MRPPLMSCIFALGTLLRSSPSNWMDPSRTSPPDGSRRSTDQAVCVLPDPDSPISPCTSPRPMFSETLSTTRVTEPSGCGYPTARPSMCSSGASVAVSCSSWTMVLLTGGTGSAAAVATAARRRRLGRALCSSSSRSALANKGERDAGDDDGQARPDHQLGVAVQVGETVVEYVPPGGNGLVAEAEEVETDLDRDGDAEDDRGLQDYRRPDHGQDVPGDDPEVAHPGDPGRVDEQLVAHPGHRRVDQPVERRGQQHPEDDHDAPERGTQYGPGREEHDDAGQRHQQGRDPGGHRLEPLAVVPGHQPAGDAEDGRDHGGQQRSGQREPG